MSHKSKTFLLTALIVYLFSSYSVAGSLYPRADGVQKSFITDEPIGEIAVAERLDIELHADFMASRDFETDAVLNWYNLGYSGGGEFNEVGGTFGDFGLHFPHEERGKRYPGWADSGDTPSVLFDGNSTMKANFPAEDGVAGTGAFTMELWVLNENPGEDEVILGWESEDGKSSSAPLRWPERLDGSEKWRHVVVTLREEEEIWYIDGKREHSTDREMFIEGGHMMVLGGCSMDSPSFSGHLAVVRVHNDLLTEEQIEHNFSGGVMLGTEPHKNIDPDADGISRFDEAWGPPCPDFRSDTSRHFRVRAHQFDEWEEEEQQDYIDDITHALELAEATYKVLSRRMARRLAVVSSRPEFRGDGIKYKIPIQAADGAFMGWHGDLGFGYGCQPRGNFNPHELVHGTQEMTGGALFEAYWEVDANFPQIYTGIYQSVPPAVCSNTSMFYEAHGRNFYHDRLMFEHLSQTPEYGPMFISKLWYDGEKREYPWLLFKRYNPDPSTSFAYEFGRMVQRNVNWDYEIFSGFEERDSDLYRSDFENAKPGVLRHGRVGLRKIPYDPDWYRPAKENAPQQAGWNVVPLEAESNEVSVEFSGYINPERGTNWRAGFVAVNDYNQSRYSDLIESGQTLRFEVKDNEELYLTVAGTPEEVMEIGIVQDFRSLEAEQFVYKVKLEDAKPRNPLWDYYENQYSLNGIAGGPHPNGSGFVADTAQVSDSAYVGLDARVLGDSKISGNSRIEDSAIISNSDIEDEAIVSGKSVVTESTVKGNTIVSGEAKVDNSHVEDYVRVRDKGRVINSNVSDFVKVAEHASADGQDVRGRAVIKGQAHSYNGDISGKPMIDGSYNKANDLDKGRWFQWSWGEGQEDGEYDEEYHGLYLQMSFNRNHAWMAWDDFGMTWGYRANDTASVSDQERDGKVLELNGEDQFVELQSCVVDQIDMSLKVWVKWDGGEPQQPVFDFGLDNDNHMYLTPSNDDDNAEFAFKLDGKTETITAEKALPEGVWSKVVLTIDKDDGARLYIDDALIGVNDAITLLPLIRQSNEFTNYLGRSQDGESYFSGRIDEFKIAMVSLPEGEVWIQEAFELD